MVSPAELRQLSMGRWVIPILAAMEGEAGSRFGVLARRLPISRSVLSNHISLLERFGWISHNPGHGHPLRPEYLLTADGRRLAGWCERLIDQRLLLGIAPAGSGRWTLPVVCELDGRSRRFSELEQCLAPITPRALSLTLKQMRFEELVERREPALYDLSSRGRRLAEVLVQVGTR